MIPKIIHYCWFGGKNLPALAQKCINSWKKYLPDYEIKEWNETNFDVNIIPYTKEAYAEKKYAFVSDYARFWILYHYGGLYFDTDVEIIKPLDDIVSRGPFMGCEVDANEIASSMPSVAPGLGLAATVGMSFYKKILDLYGTLHFVNSDNIQNLTTVVTYTTNLLVSHGLRSKRGIQLIDGMWIYPKEYFCPMNTLCQMEKTVNTRTIHHYSASWLPYHKQFIKKLKRLLGYSFSSRIRAVFVKFHLLKK